MTSKAPKKAAHFLPYRKVLPEGFVCPGPEYLREDMLQAEPIAESAQGGRLMFYDRNTGEYLNNIRRGTRCPPADCHPTGHRVV